ncbi:hypothetical protein [Olsenella sp. Marseille-P4559]|uniref:hypothetical protein n=1 Tax=Olsenella sp. Marseille-P4559 TaxID=2364795 RepID=UPI001032500F|nr:hypothetical protein [Olsenella sp. Marseille-P4559]
MSQKQTSSDGITITVMAPTGIELASIDASSQMNDVNLQGVSSARTSVSSQMDDVDVNDIDLSNATLELSVEMGEAALGGDEVQSGTVARGTGEKVIEASAEMGDVTVTAL